MNPQSIAELFEAAAAAFAALRLFHFGLHKTQPSMALYLSVTSFYLFFLSAFPTNSPTYFWGYLASIGITWVVCVYALSQMFSLALAQFPGLRTGSRRALWWSVGCAAVVSFCVAMASRSQASGHRPLYYVESVHRWVMLALALFIALFLLLLSRYSLPLSRNTTVSCGFFCAAFAAEALALLVDTLSPHYYSQNVDTARVLFEGGCLTAWAFALRRDGSETRRRLPVEGREARLLSELGALDAFVTRASGR